MKQTIEICLKLKSELSNKINDDDIKKFKEINGFDLLNEHNEVCEEAIMLGKKLQIQEMESILEKLFDCKVEDVPYFDVKFEIEDTDEITANH